MSVLRYSTEYCILVRLIDIVRCLTKAIFSCSGLRSISVTKFEYAIAITQLHNTFGWPILTDPFVLSYMVAISIRCAIDRDVKSSITSDKSDPVKHEG